jgi:hypothetical protein
LLRFPYRASSAKENGGIFGRGFNNGNASVKTALGCYNLYRPAFIFGRAHRVISAPMTGNLKSSIAHSIDATWTMGEPYRKILQDLFNG